MTVREFTAREHCENVCRETPDTDDGDERPEPPRGEPGEKADYVIRKPRNEDKREQAWNPNSLNKPIKPCEYVIVEQLFDERSSVSLRETERNSTPDKDASKTVDGSEDGSKQIASGERDNLPRNRRDNHLSCLNHDEDEWREHTELTDPRPECNNIKYKRRVLASSYIEGGQAGDSQNEDEKRPLPVLTRGKNPHLQCDSVAIRLKPVVRIRMSDYEVPKRLDVCRTAEPVESARGFSGASCAILTELFLIEPWWCSRRRRTVAVRIEDASNLIRRTDSAAECRKVFSQGRTTTCERGTDDCCALPQTPDRLSKD